jgi:hypothetical protein
MTSGLEKRSRWKIDHGADEGKLCDLQYAAITNSTHPIESRAKS